MITIDECQRCADEVAIAVEGVFASLQHVGDRLADQWTSVSMNGAPFTTADLVDLQPRIFEMLDTQLAFDSGGYVFAESILADRLRYLDWWHRGHARTYHPLVLELEVGTPDCYDYYSMEWFRAALTEQRRYVSGPLIDLPCAAVYVMTFSQPVVVEGRLLGVAGADVAVGRFEDDLLPPLLGVPQPTVLVSSERRVIVSNDARWTTGERVRTMPDAAAPEWEAAVRVTNDLGWVVGVAVD